MKSLTFIVTNRCNITCEFCAPGCGPQYHGGLNTELMKKVFDRLLLYGPVPVVVFTGGEPMLFHHEVIETIRHIANRSKTSTRIVTNAHWANSPEAAESTVRELKEAGLTELNYSVDDFHQAHVPEEFIVNAVNAAIKLNIPVLLAHKTYPGSKSCKDYYESLLGMKIPVFEKLRNKCGVSEPLLFSSGYTLPIGRGADKVNLDEWIPTCFGEKRWRGPCVHVLERIQITPDGKLTPCCGLVDKKIDVFYAGSVIENDFLDVLEQANKSVLYNWLALEGPSGIMDYILSKDDTIPFARKYVQNCQLCQEIFTDPRKREMVAHGLEEKALILSLKRCLYESQRAACLEKRHSQIEDQENLAQIC